jgi:hypothetical protein
MMIQIIRARRYFRLHGVSSEYRGEMLNNKQHGQHLFTRAGVGAGQSSRLEGRGRRTGGGH